MSNLIKRSAVNKIIRMLAEADDDYYSEETLGQLLASLYGDKDRVVSIESAKMVPEFDE